MNINLIGVPINYGCDRDGVEFGPNKLRKSGIIEGLESNGKKVYDMGNLCIPTIDENDKYKWHDKMKYLKPVVDVNRNLAHLVYSSLNSNSFPLVIGGDHSLGLGSISGASKYFKNMAIIWIDAHGDINDGETSPSGHIHGMPLAGAMNVGHPDLTDLYYPGQKVRPENVYIIGARDLDPGEVILAKNLNLNLYEMETIRKLGLENQLEDVIQKIKKSGVDGVHLSFDIDCLDPSIVPGTGTPVKDGFTLEEGNTIFKYLLNSRLITSMDFVEYNPKIDDKSNTTLNTCMDLFKSFSKLI